MSRRLGTLARGSLVWLRRSRAARLAAWLLAAYAALGWGFALSTRTRGLLSPGGSVRPDMVLLGVTYLTTRIAVRLLVPALVAGAVTAPLLEKLRTALGRRRVTSE